MHDPLDRLDLTPDVVAWGAGLHATYRALGRSPYVKQNPWRRWKHFHHAARRFERLRFGERSRPGSNVAWPLTDPHWAYSVEFDESGRCVSVTVSAAPERDGEPVTAEAFRVPLGKIIAVAAARYGGEDVEARRRTRTEQIRAQDERLKARGLPVVKTAEARVGWQEISGSGRGGRRRGAGRPPLSDEFLEEVGEVYRQALAAGENGYRAVQAHVAAQQGTVPKPATVEGWISKARKRNVLDLPRLRSGLKRRV